MASAARLGFEHAADLVKSYYTQDFRKVTDNYPVPVLVAGGPRMETIEESLQAVPSQKRSPNQRLYSVNERAEG